MKEQIDDSHFYFTDDGLMVFTEQYHLDRGYCCRNGCRHCPYFFETNSSSEIEILPFIKSDNNCDCANQKK